MARGRKPGEQLRVTRMAQRFDNTGVVKVQASEGVFSAMSLENMPFPPDAGTQVDGRWYFYLDSRSMGADSKRYRVCWPEPASPASKKLRTSAFSLTGAHTNETLYVLAEFLRDQGVDYVGLANEHGTMFKDSRLHGSKLAYLTRDIPHSPACHVDFIETDTPEVVRAPGRVLYNPLFYGQTE